MKVKIGKLRCGEVFLTPVTKRGGTVFDHKDTQGVSVILDPLPGTEVSQEKTLHPEVLVEVAGVITRRALGL